MAKSDVQIALRLPTELHEELKASDNVSEEIRRRLETASADEVTRVLQYDIRECARLLAQHWVAWYDDAEAWQIFRDAINRLLDEVKPETSGATPKSRDAEIMFGGDGAGERLALSVTWRAP